MSPSLSISLTERLPAVFFVPATGALGKAGLKRVSKPIPPSTTSANSGTRIDVRVAANQTNGNSVKNSVDWDDVPSFLKLPGFTPPRKNKHGMTLADVPAWLHKEVR